MINRLLYRKNRLAFPPGELAKYRSQWVAFASDGSRVLASGEDLERLESQLAGLGIDAQDVAFEYVPGPEEGANVGGAETV
jgi:hypothetical protein